LEKKWHENVELLTDTVPAAPLPPTTSYDSSSDNVTIVWSDPSDTGSLPITGYIVEIE
jgi:hypothetical protein